VGGNSHERLLGKQNLTEEKRLINQEKIVAKRLDNLKIIEEKKLTSQNILKLIYPHFLGVIELIDSNQNATLQDNMPPINFSDCLNAKKIISAITFKSLMPISNTIKTFIENRIVTLKPVSFEDFSYNLLTQNNCSFNYRDFNNFRFSISEFKHNYIPEIFLYFATYDEGLLTESYNNLREPAQEFSSRQYSDEAFIEFAIKAAQIHNLDISEMANPTKENILDLLSILSEGETFYAIKTCINSASNYSKTYGLPSSQSRNVVISYLNKAKEKYGKDIKDGGFSAYRPLAPWELEEIWNIKILKNELRDNSNFLKKFNDHESLIKFFNFHSNT
jgi:hypothetical protein